MSSAMVIAPELARPIQRVEHEKMVELGLFADERVELLHGVMIVEMADSSLETERTTKARLYAESGVEEYWVVNVRDGIIEVHEDIVRGAHARIAPYRPGAVIRLRAFPDVEIAASDVL